MADAETIKILAEMYGELSHQPTTELSPDETILKDSIIKALLRCIDRLS